MSSIMMPELEPAPPATAERRTGRRVFRKRTRKLIRDTLQKLRAIRNADTREEGRATLHGYNPTLVKKARNSSEDRAIDKIMERLQECLDMVA